MNPALGLRSNPTSSSPSLLSLASGFPPVQLWINDTDEWMNLVSLKASLIQFNLFQRGFTLPSVPFCVTQMCQPYQSHYTPSLSTFHFLWQWLCRCWPRERKREREDKSSLCLSSALKSQWNLEFILWTGAPSWTCAACVVCFKRSKRSAAYFNIFLLLIPQSPWGLFGGVRLASSLEPSAMMKRLQACEKLSAAHFSRRAALTALYPLWPFRETANPNMQGRKPECTWLRLAAWHQCFLLSGRFYFSFENGNGFLLFASSLRVRRRGFLLKSFFTSTFLTNLNHCKHQRSQPRYKVDLHYMSK